MFYHFSLRFDQMMEWCRSGHIPGMAESWDGKWIMSGIHWTSCLLGVLPSIPCNGQHWTTTFMTFAAWKIGCWAAFENKGAGQRTEGKAKSILFARSTIPQSDHERNEGVKISNNVPVNPKYDLFQDKYSQGVVNPTHGFSVCFHADSMRYLSHGRWCQVRFI